MKITTINPPENGLGESGHWDKVKATLLWVDFPGGKIHRYNPDTGLLGCQDTRDQVSFAVPRANGEGLVISQRFHLDFLDETSGVQTTFVSKEGLGLPENHATNDGKCDARGRLWFGTFDSSCPLDQVPPTAALYSVQANGVVKQHAQGFKLCNGLDWTVDQRTFLLADTMWNCIFAFDFDLETGSVCRQRKAIDFSGEGLPGKPDGLTVDGKDGVWVAFFMGSSVGHYDLSTGKRLRTIDFSPTSIITCPNFGGPNFEDLYVTSCKALLSEEQKQNQPEAGCVFKVTELGEKGKAPHKFAG